MRRNGVRLGVLIAGGLLLAALAAEPDGESARIAAALRWVAPAGVPLARPSGAVQEAAPGAALQPLLDALPEGGVLCLAPGDYRGNLVLRRRVTLWGPRAAVVRGSGRGTTIRVEAAGCALAGFTVSGSGSRYDLHDAALHVVADDVRVEGLRIERALFGILVEKARRVALRGNQIVGTPGEALGLRGDTIRLWETRDSIVEGNQLIGGRDVVIWYSSGNRILANHVSHGRYGTHLMYSHDNVVADNRYVSNTVGVFIMYSRNVVIERNIMLHSSGSGGMGLGLKESGNLTVRRNRFLHDTHGVFIDTSPMNPDDQIEFSGNVFRLCEVGVNFHSSPRRQTFVGNTFGDNQHHVRVDGRGDARGIRWSGNHFDDYQGYDLDGDGKGDVPYVLRRLSAELTGRNPDLLLFRGAPALSMVDVASHVVPLYAPRTVLIDERPRMRAARSDDAD